MLAWIARKVLIPASPTPGLGPEALWRAGQDDLATVGVAELPRGRRARIIARARRAHASRAPRSASSSRNTER